jgi:hypothetical protein
MLVDFTCNTDGKGHWSNHALTVRCLELDLEVFEDDDGLKDFGELRIRLDLATWDPMQHGLIYTDKLFLKELRVELERLGFSKEAIAEVEYSEQGMQGEDYVSLDVYGESFISEFLELCLK